MAQWDVHYWTKEINSSQYKDVLNFFTNRMFLEPEKYVKDLYEEIANTLKQKGFYNDTIHMALNKMTCRTNPVNYTYIDPDLNNLDINILLYETWELIKKLDSYKEFSETLFEIEQHCIQGDSHRLWTLYIALLNC